MEQVTLTFNRELLIEAVRSPRQRQKRVIAQARAGNYMPVRLWFARSCYSTMLKKVYASWNPLTWARVYYYGEKFASWKAFETTLAKLRRLPVALEI